MCNSVTDSENELSGLFVARSKRSESYGVGEARRILVQPREDAMPPSVRWRIILRIASRA